MRWLKDICNSIKELIKKPTCDGTKARALINTNGEIEENEYEAHLEKELLLRCKTKIEFWARRRKDGECRVLVFGGMRNDVACALLNALQESITDRVSVGVYEKSMSGGLRQDLRLVVEKKKNLFYVFDDNDENIKELYDVIICAHYWQHRQFEDLKKVGYHLKNGGLLIWLSASARGCQKDDVEFVCEGFPPSEPKAVGSMRLASDCNNPEDLYGVAIPYVPMDQYSNGDKKWIKYDFLGYSLPFFL